MPTPVTIARQCLTPEAVQTLDDAVVVAHRRCHAQTTSLHAVSALLSLPSSPLREACGRARNSAYASRVQFKALELYLGVSLDRLPSTLQRVEEPPVSNSLMAAIKRSQANQRRQPESFYMYQQTASFSPASPPSATVKVELRNLILSILDDPVVSRVFGESGFRSSDIKLSILRPVHRHLLRCKNPIFLCNLTNNFGFPFHGFVESNEICKQIDEILVRKEGKKRSNPLLVGASAIDAVKSFLETIQKRKIGAFSAPESLNLRVICVKDEIFSFVSGNSDVGLLERRLDEVGDVLKQSAGPGVMVDYGDLKVLTGQRSLDSVSFVVSKLGGLMKLHDGRVWLIGAAESHETCLQFFKQFPEVEDDWDLQVLPINSLRPSMAGTFPKSSLMESFVPFGGFFSMPSDIKTPLKISSHFGTLCHICDEKLKLEVNAVSKGGLKASVSNQYLSTLPSWLQTLEICTNGEMDGVQAQDDPVVAGAKVIGLQKKWHTICHRLHQSEPYVPMLPRATYTVGPHVPSVVGFQVVESSKQNTGFQVVESSKQDIGDPNTSSIESGCHAISKSNSNSNSRSLKESPIVCNLERDDSSSGNSVTTDLGLGVNRSSSSFPVCHGRFDQKDSKLLYSNLFTRVGRQEEALGVVSRTVARCRARQGPSRGGIWFGFVGPDRIAKEKVSGALAEVLFGGRENRICVDLSRQDFMDGRDSKSRGKNIIDFVADELGKKPLSVVFLENVDMADTLTQHHLSRAASSGRFSNSHGREVSITNAIFVLTSNLVGVTELNPDDSYTEEAVLTAKTGPIRLLTGFDLSDMKPTPTVVRVTKDRRTGSFGSRTSSPVCKNKRKLDDGSEVASHNRQSIVNSLNLDLNLPADENEANFNSAPENSRSWLEDLLQHMDEKVVFKAFDFDQLAEKILEQVGECFRKTVVSGCSLEIDSKAMERFLKGWCFLGASETEDWVGRVLGKAFAEAQKKYGLGSHSVVKLVSGGSPEEQPAGGVLPDRIIMS